MELSTASNVCTNELDEEMESVNCVVYVSGLAACSVGWFVSLLVCLCEREVLLAGSCKQCSCEGAGQLLFT